MLAHFTSWFGMALLALSSSACTGVLEGLQPVQNFQVERYLGQWYEIARLDHRFERGLSQVTEVLCLE